MKRIGISLSLRHDREDQDYLNCSYARYFCHLGWMPLLIPNGLTDPCSYVTEFAVQAILLSGGHDEVRGVDSPGLSVDSYRDRTERHLIDWAIRTRTPVLGICRGMHLLNAYMGGTVSFDVAATGVARTSHVACKHSIQLCHDHTRDTAGATDMLVNSYHRHGISLAALGRDMLPFALSSDDPDLVEGLMHRTLPLAGIQWHPERDSPYDHLSSRLVAAFLDPTWWRLAFNESDHPSCR